MTETTNEIQGISILSTNQTGWLWTTVHGCLWFIYLETTEDGEKVVENHHIAVDGHEAQQPGGADEQQKEKGHSKSRAVERNTQRWHIYIYIYLQIIYNNIYISDK